MTNNYNAALAVANNVVPHINVDCARCADWPRGGSFT